MFAEQFRECSRARLLYFTSVVFQILLYNKIDIARDRMATIRFYSGDNIYRIW